MLLNLLIEPLLIYNTLSILINSESSSLSIFLIINNNFDLCNLIWSDNRLNTWLNRSNDSLDKCFESKVTLKLILVVRFELFLKVLSSLFLLLFLLLLVDHLSLLVHLFGGLLVDEWNVVV